MSNITDHQSIRIVASDPLLELDASHHFRIRVVYTSASASACAVAAVRCEDQREVHWLSAPLCSPLEAVKVMMDGFILPADLSDSARAVIRHLLAEGKAIGSDVRSALAA